MGKKERAKERAKELAAQVKGVSKKQHGTKKKQKKAARSDSEDVGVVAKKKKRFFAVAVGKKPGIYSDSAEFAEQMSQFPGAKGRKFHTLAKAQRFMKAHSKCDLAVPAKTQQAITQAAKGGLLTDKAGNTIKFTSLARGFTLGTVRVGGRSVLSDAAKPVFAPTVPGSGAVLPQHEDLGRLRDSTEDVAAGRPADACTQEDRGGAGKEVVEIESETDEDGREIEEGAAPDINADDHEDVEVVESGQEIDEEGEGHPEGRGSGPAGASEGGAAPGAAEGGGAVQRQAQDLDEDFIAFSSDSDDGGGAASPGPAAAAAAAAAAKPTISPHMKAQAPAEAGAVREYADDELPWYDGNTRIESQSARLHNEIVELTSLLQPSEEEDAQRLQAKKLLEDIVFEIFPGSSLEIFGSFATGMHLPTSDVDCVITGSSVAPSQAGSALTALGTALRGKEWVKDLEVIAKARVPIVKLFVMPWGLKFDISLGVGGGIPAAGYIREQLALWPPLKPLVTILKLFLLQRNMNEVYSGGLGSFALILSVVAFLKIHTSRLPRREGGRAEQLDCNLGLLLIDYFRFFGRQLAVTKVGVACGGDTHAAGCYLKARVFEPSMDRRDRGDRLSIRDPLDPSNDVSRGAFNSTAVRYAFDHAYHMLTHQPSELAEMSHNELLEWRGISRLAWILRLDEVLAIRPPTPRKGGKRRRTTHAPHVAPSRHNNPPPARAVLRNLKSSPPKRLPRPAKHNSSGSGGVDQFFGQEGSRKGPGGRTPRSPTPRAAGGAPLVAAHGHSLQRSPGHRAGGRHASGHQLHAQETGGYRGGGGRTGYREWDDVGGMRGHSRRGDQGNGGWRPVRH